MKSHVHKKSVRANFFQIIFVTISAIDSWNKMPGQMDAIALKDPRPTKIKWLLIDKFIKSY